MARLFGKEYHEHSNSWYFKSTITPLQKNDVSYKKFLDETGNAVFRFESQNRRKFPADLEITYDKRQHKIIAHKCSLCDVEVCSHYLSILNYAYYNLSTDILEKNVVQTYQTKMLSYNEYWQRVVLNAIIEISDIFNRKTDKIRFHFPTYKPMLVRIISLLAANREVKEEDVPLLEKAAKQSSALSESEIEFLKLLQQQKCSFSRKGTFFTIYKKDFVQFFPIMKTLQHKLFIKETGDKLEFSEQEYHLNFQVNRYKEDEFIFKASPSEKISAVFVGKTTYIFNKNQVYNINLPFTKEVAEQIFDEGYILKKEDLVYVASVVARQLGLMKCYIDFAEDIQIPEIYHNTPIITFRLFKEGEKIIMNGLLDYGNNVLIPMSVVRFPAELVRFDQNSQITWFYIPTQIKYQIYEFLEKLPEAETNRIEENSQLLFQGEDNIAALKKTIFENALPSWNIVLSDELKQEFVYKVNLKPIIKTQSSENINWFEYQVQYKYKDITFSHDELKQFFNTKEKFLKLEDGRLLYFENKDSFYEIENLLKRSKKEKSDSYKLSIYNLPYVYQLSSIKKGIRIEGEQFLEDMFTNIINRKLPEPTEVPSVLRPVMRSYQKNGYQWLKMLEYYGLNGILADDMGLGKTIQAISVLSDLPSTSRNIVICPKTLLYNWAAEIKKFNPSLSYLIYEGNQKIRRSYLDNLNVNVLLASYSIIQNDIKKLAEIEFDYIILDEAQHIKNAAALRSKAVKKLKTRHKLVLSGTPIENNASELWSIFDFLLPGYLPPHRKFKSEFNEQDKKAQQRLSQMISPFILRRKKQDVLIELPDKQIQIAYSKLTQVQEKMYLQVLDKVKKGFQKFPGDMTYMHVLAALTKLRQICDHPYLYDKTAKTDSELSGKMELMREIILEAKESGRKLLIFSQFVQMLKVLKEMMTELDIPFEYMDGSTKHRQKRIDNFNNSNKIRAFLISLKTGGYGLNLTAADTVLITDPWWNPMGENQAIDRAHRIGQTKKVMVYKMITQGTIEEKILDLQQKKRELFENLIEQGQNVIKKMTPDQLQELFEY